MKMIRFIFLIWGTAVLTARSVVVFNADFNASPVSAYTNGGSASHADIAAGTSVGSWGGLPDDEIYIYQNTSGDDHALLVDGTCYHSDGYNLTLALTLNFTNNLQLTDASFSLGFKNLRATPTGKNFQILGYDHLDKTVFQYQLSCDTTTTGLLRRVMVWDAGIQDYVPYAGGADGELPRQFIQNDTTIVPFVYDAAFGHVDIAVDMTATGYTLMLVDGATTNWITPEIVFSDPAATNLAYVKILGNNGNPDAKAGSYFDNLRAEGLVTNIVDYYKFPATATASVYQDGSVNESTLTNISIMRVGYVPASSNAFSAVASFDMQEVQAALGDLELVFDAVCSLTGSALQDSANVGGGVGLDMYFLGFYNEPSPADANSPAAAFHYVGEHDTNYLRITDHATDKSAFTVDGTNTSYTSPNLIYAFRTYNPSIHGRYAHFRISADSPITPTGGGIDRGFDFYSATGASPPKLIFSTKAEYLNMPPDDGVGNESLMQTGKLPDSATGVNFVMIYIDDLKPIVGYESEDAKNFLQRIYPDPAKRAQMSDLLTPNMNRLADEGVAFMRAYCPSTVCCPSRTAVMSGYRPHVSGVYGNYNYDTTPPAEIPLKVFRESHYPWLNGVITMTQNLVLQGYYAAGSGKIYHNSVSRYETVGGKKILEHDQADIRFSWNQWLNSYTLPEYELRTGHDVSYYAPVDSEYSIPGTDYIFGKHAGDFEAQSDYRRADFTARLLEQGSVTYNDSIAGRDKTFTLPEGKPFFLACGIFRPHLPFYTTSDNFAGIDLEDIAVDMDFYDEILADGDDLQGTALTWYDNGAMQDLFDHAVVTNDTDGDGLVDSDENGDGFTDTNDEVKLWAWKTIIQHYLACVRHADRCVGRVLEGIDNSGHADDTVVILISDHGWFFGEKNRLSKTRLWDEVCQIPMIIKDPTRPQSAGKRCYRTVSQHDLYRTLASLAGVGAPPHAAGRDIKPLLDDPVTPWNIPALTTYNEGNHSIRTEEYRYIQYGFKEGIPSDPADPGELYDDDVDPEEFNNLINDPSYTAVRLDLNSKLETALNEETFAGERKATPKNWRHGYFGSAKGAGESTDTGDPDSDLIPNYAEYLFFTDPLAADTPVRPTMTISNSAATLEFRSRSDTGTYEFHLEYNDDLMHLLNWTPVWSLAPGGTPTDVIETDSSGNVRIQVLENLSGQGFYRFSVQEP
ncbi:MAG: sulfatase-like hydrolase/transferase [Kiritimatiellales bacterium]|nr:sulfatase-like hydrolase/transferase [Kiritimatiellales bacterium]